jgi:hypothetical protein
MQLQTLRITDDFLTAMAWCGLNLSGPVSPPVMIKGRLKVPVHDAMHLLHSFGEFLPVKEVGDIPAEGLLQDPVITHAYLIHNWTRPDWNHGILEIVVLYQNSLGELLFEKFSGEKCLEQFLTVFLGRMVGPAGLPGLAWKVHYPREVISNRKKLCDQLGKVIELYIQKAVGR